MDDACRVVFGRPGAPHTDVATAVGASSAIPGYFAPVTIHGRRYVDGGVHSPTNADVLRREDLDLVGHGSIRACKKPLATLTLAASCNWTKANL